jgi:hypothetical protein
MPHKTDEIVHQGLLHPWTEPEEYPGVAQHFSAVEIARLVGLEAKEHITLRDKFFLWRMYRRLIFTAV